MIMQFPNLFALIFYAMTMLSISAQESITIHSYFGKGFGTLIRENISFEYVISEKDDILSPPALWYAYKQGVNRATEKINRIQIIFESDSVRKKFEGLSNGKTSINLQVIGYETFYVTGQPGLGIANFPNHVPIADVSWGVVKDFVVYDIEN